LIDEGVDVEAERPHRRLRLLPEVAALQVEMAWRLYMDEADALHGTTHPKFARFKQVLRGVFAALVDEVKKRGKLSK